jgi:glycosyltransferase involved in cell wall biosynthesis
LKISVVIPAFNEEKLIAASLVSVRDAVRAFAERGWESELIVCDNNSTDRTAELARAAGATVVFEPVNQIARARNKGAEAATGEWLIFVDADSHPRRELFGEVAGVIQSGRHLYGGATIKLDGQHRAANALTEFWNLLSRIKRYAAGSFLFCETAAFRRLGGFDINLFASEEIDLSRRLKQAARAEGKSGVIFHRHPVVSSGRKVRLYSSRELLFFMLRASLSPRRTVRDQKACHAWYDGRR